MRHYGMKDGLPSPNIYYALQDSKGYIWLATDRGVSRFNGYEFETFDFNDGLPDNTVFEIFEDSEGRIWFAPFNLELAYFENGKIHRYAYNDAIAQYAEAYHVASFLHVSDNGTVYLGIYEKGLITITANGAISSLKNEHPESTNTSMAITIDGITYPSSITSKSEDMRGMEIISIDETVSRKFYPHHINLSPKPSVAVLNNEVLFAGIEHLLIPQKKNSSSKTFDNWIINLHVDKQENLWVSCRGNGVFCFKNGNLEAPPTSYLPSASVTYIFEDHEGGIWFCTEGLGLFYASTLAIQEYSYGEHLSSKNVNSIAADKNNQLFIGFNDGYIDRVTNDQIETFRQGPKNPREPQSVRNIIYNEEEDRLLFISSGIPSSINLNHSPPKREYPFSKQVEGMRFLFKNSKDWFWMGNKREAVGFAPPFSSAIPVQLKFEELEGTSPSGNRLAVLNEDAEGRLLAGTFAGLYRMEDDLLKYQGHVHPFFTSRITDILKTEETLCISSRTDGVALWNGNTVTVLNKRSGLSSNHVNALAQDAQGHLWLASNSGLDEVYKNEMNEWKVQHYGTQHGLPAKEINCLLFQDNIIWLGTTDGLLRFDLLNYQVNTFPPPVHITSISINQKDTALQDYYSLAYNNNYLHIDFLGIAFKHGKKLKYRYRMDGVDNEWVTTQERSVQYPTLPDGDYTFEVIAENEWGTPSREAARFSFHIAPPWWETLAARLLFLSVVVVLVTLFFVLRVSAIKKREKERSALSNEISEMKLKLLRAQMNPHFTFNTINSILDYISKNDRHNARNYLSKFALLLRYILEGSDKALNTIAEEVKALELYLQLEKFRFGEKLQYQISIGKNVVPEFDRIPTMLIQPLIENAILHGIMPKKESGTVHLRIDKSAHFICVEVEDDGVGRSTKNEKRANGHKSMSTGIVKDRLRLLNKAKSTTVHFKITDLSNAEGKALGTHVQLQIAAN